MSPNEILEKQFNEVFNTHPNTEEALRLFIAAPEMLQALCAVSELIASYRFHNADHRLKVWEQVDAAIKKAKGENE